MKYIAIEAGFAFEIWSTKDNQELFTERICAVHDLTDARYLLHLLNSLVTVDTTEDTDKVDELSETPTVGSTESKVTFETVNKLAKHYYEKAKEETVRPTGKYCSKYTTEYCLSNGLDMEGTWHNCCHQREVAHELKHPWRHECQCGFRWVL